MINSNLNPISHRYWSRYSDLLTKKRNFCPPLSHLAPSFGVIPFEFMEKLYGSWNYEIRVFRAAEGKDLVIVSLSCTVFDWSTRVTDGHTDRQNYDG